MLEMCPQADAVTLRERGRQAGKGGQDKRVGAVIISGKRDFKYFMLLKLAAKKKRRKIQQRQRGGGEGAEEEGVTRCGCHGCQQGNAPTSACTSRTRARAVTKLRRVCARVWQAT